MFTLHHGFWLYFLSRRHPFVWYFVLGSMLPDYIYLVLIVVMLYDGNISIPELITMSPKVMMSYLPIYSWAVMIDLIGHSVVFWGAFFALSMFKRLSKTRAVVVGWGTHLLLDELTHGAHANFYLYPLSMSAVHSPVSYWEPAYFAAEFKAVNGAIMTAMAVYLIYNWWNHRKNNK
ncbi:hypothetical protein [Dendrosporobacter sp. 1207_IL3150]|uniref:hypothetical protein n=1 Tax=Dendrosporobacter sp. 1207_IL3150 TaxID=3084054 RepID=UPI002FD96C12